MEFHLYKIVLSYCILISNMRLKIVHVPSLKMLGYLGGEALGGRVGWGKGTSSFSVLRV